MNKYKRNIPGLLRPADALPPIALLIPALMGRDGVSLYLFIALFAVRLFSLACADGLRATFARQPSMRYVQGSAALALLLQLPGAALAALAGLLSGQGSSIYPLIAAGALLNVEHVFYEYLHAVGDGISASLCHGISALLTLAGVLLCAPPAGGSMLPEGLDAVWLLSATGLSALVGLVISLALGGKLKPRLNAEILRRAPASLLQSLLYPALALGLIFFLKLSPAAVPLCVGWTVYELCRTPFRRTPSESKGMNRALRLLCGVAGVCIIMQRLFPHTLPEAMATAGGAALLAAVCGLGLFGNVEKPEQA